MIIAKTTMKYLPSSCKTCELHTESIFDEYKRIISCYITKEFTLEKDLKLCKKFRNCPLEKKN